MASPPSCRLACLLCIVGAVAGARVGLGFGGFARGILRRPRSGLVRAAAAGDRVRTTALRYDARGRPPLYALGADEEDFCRFLAWRRGGSPAFYQARLRNVTIENDADSRAHLQRAWRHQRLLVANKDAMAALRAPESAAERFERELEGHARRQLSIRRDARGVRAARRYMRRFDAPPPTADNTLAVEPELAAPQADARAEAHLRALLAWFRQRFLYYHRGCLHSQCATPSRGSEQPEHVHILGAIGPRRLERWLGAASAAELHLCSTDADQAEDADGAERGEERPSGCGRVSRFVRFNSIRPILAARRGRCGEYSFAWLLFLRGAGFEARWVADWADHCWCEVRLPGSGRWVHTDPCEEAYDEPRMYADGWGKRHAFVFAFGDEGAVEVTAEYAKDERTVRQQRGVVSDEAVGDIARRVNARVHSPAHRSRC